MTESGQVSNRNERDVRFLSNNDDLLKVLSEVVSPEIVEITSRIEQEDWNTTNDIHKEVEQLDNLFKYGLSFVYLLNFSCQALEICKWNHQKTSKEEEDIANDNEH